MPIRLWSTVTSQLASRPRCQVGTGVWASTANELLLQVRGERVHLAIAPVLPDGRHLVAPVAHDLLNGLRVRNESVGGELRADVSLAGEAVALAAGAAERLLAEV